MLRFIFILIFANVVFVAGQTNDDCMECHADKDLTNTVNDEHELSLYEDIEEFQNSLHADSDCIDCHSDLAEDYDDGHDENLARVNCAQCHEDVQDDYNKSIHGG